MQFSRYKLRVIKKDWLLQLRINQVFGLSKMNSVESYSLERR